MGTKIPEEVGLSTQRLERLNKMMQEYVDQGKFAGMLTMVVRCGQVAHFEPFGLMDIESNKPMQRDTIFRIYSMTKPITSVALMMLYEEGRFHLNDPVSKFIPAFKKLKVFVQPDFAGLKLVEQEREMTIRDLLTHTSGLSYGFFDDLPIETMYREAKLLSPDNTLEELVQKLAEIPLLFQPGTAWRYSVSTDVVGYLVQAISGISFDVFLQEKIFDPLGMIDTSFYVSKEKIDRFAVTYGPAKEEGLKIVDAPASSHFSRYRSFLSGGGGLVSTATDYLRFCQLLLNNGELDSVRLLSRKTVELMTLNHLTAELMPIQIGGNILGGFGFGLGFRVMVNPAQAATPGSVGEFGWAGAANTYFWIDPKESLIGMLMTQFMPSGHYPISNDFRVLTYQSIID